MGLSSVPTSCILGSAVVIGAAKALGSPVGAAFAPAPPVFRAPVVGGAADAGNPCIPRAGARARAYRGALLATPRHSRANMPHSPPPRGQQRHSCPQRGGPPMRAIAMERPRKQREHTEVHRFECVLEGKGFFLRNQVAAQRKGRAGLRAVGWGRWLSNLLLALPAAPSAAPRCPARKLPRCPASCPTDGPGRVPHCAQRHG